MANPARYFSNQKLPNRALEPHAQAHDELLASLSRINAYNPPVQTCSTGWTFHGLYAGPTSIAFLFTRLSQIYPTMTFKGQDLIDWAISYLDLGLARRGPIVDPDHCGIANETLSHLALRCLISKDPSLISQLCGYSSTINSGPAGGSNEMLYGRAGYLYFLRLVTFTLTQSTSSSKSAKKALLTLQTTIHLTIERILASPQPWTWHGKAYLGAAHGSIGILTQIALCLPLLGLGEDYNLQIQSQLEPLLSSVLNTQTPSGEFPSSTTPDTSPSRLVQFCHGAPGLVLSLRSLHPHFPFLRSRIDVAITLSESVIWERGLLTKSPSLCHGIAGNALALKDDSDFGAFLRWMTSESLEVQGWMSDAGRSDEFASLFTGEAGRAWTWAVADRKLDRKVLGYNDV